MCKRILYCLSIFLLLAITGNAVAVTYYFYDTTGDHQFSTTANWSGTGVPPFLPADNATIRSDSSLGDYCVFGAADSLVITAFKVGDAGYTNGKFVMNGGSINLSTSTVGFQVYIGAWDGASTAVFEMNSGIFTTGGRTRIGLSGSTGILNLNGGTYNAVGAGAYAGQLQVGDATGTGTINITGGTLRLQGDKTVTTLYVGSTGTIQAYGGAGVLNKVYDAGTDVTTITAFSPSFGGASGASPYIGESGVDVSPILTWAPGGGVQDTNEHIVYFSNVFSDVNEGNPAVKTIRDVNNFRPGKLEFGETYYWRVDEVNDATSDLWPGNVWQFTTKKFLLGSSDLIPNPDNVAWYDNMPDGHAPMIQSLDGNSLIWFWPKGSSYRRIIPADNIDDLETTGYYAEPDAAVMSKRPGEPDSSGVWLNYVSRQDNNNILAIYHAEDNEFTDGGSGMWASAMRAVSRDEGVTWTEREQVITSYRPKPDEATMSGMVGHGAFYDSNSGYYYVYYWDTPNTCVARSNDPNGSVGTWYKYYNGGFTEPGLGGNSSPVPGLGGWACLDFNVVWNTHLEKYIAIFAQMTRPFKLYITASDDLLHWDLPELLFDPGEMVNCRYPTLIGTTAEHGTTDSYMGALGWLIYKHHYDRRGPDDDRQWQMRRIAFDILDGDADLNNKVDEIDLMALSDNWLGGPSMNWNEGNFDNNYDVDFIDFALLSSNWLMEWSGF